MSTMRILIVEDEKTLANLIKKGFEEEGFAVDVAYNGEDGLFFAKNNTYDAIVLDIMLPIIDGISLLKELREENISTPVIILTAKDSVKDKVLGLDSGSDDYLTKPFSFEELLSRVKALIRRKFAASSPIIKICDLVIDTAEKTVKRGNKRIDLSAKEYALLEYLALNKNKVISRTAIAVSFNRTFERLDNAFTKQKQFVADVSHELKTPLSVILMETEIALRKQRSIQEYINTINQIKETSQHMKGIIETLFKLIKIENTQLLEKKTLDIKEIIQRSSALLKDQIEKRNLKFNIQGSTFLIDADDTLIMEVFLNLIDNAIKYNKENGTIDIMIYPEKRVEIIDSGIGIPKDSLNRVFDKFYRADPSRSKEIEGLGLGLSLVKEILDLHNARIEIDSTPNMGTKVSILF